MGGETYLRGEALLGLDRDDLRASQRGPDGEEPAVGAKIDDPTIGGIVKPAAEVDVAAVHLACAGRVGAGREQRAPVDVRKDAPERAQVRSAGCSERDPAHSGRRADEAMPAHRVARWGGASADRNDVADGPAMPSYMSTSCLSLVGGDCVRRAAYAGLVPGVVEAEAKPCPPIEHAETRYVHVDEQCDGLGWNGGNYVLDHCTRAAAGCRRVIECRHSSGRSEGAPSAFGFQLRIVQCVCVAMRLGPCDPHRRCRGQALDGPSTQTRLAYDASVELGYRRSTSRTIQDRCTSRSAESRCPGTRAGGDVRTPRTKGREAGRYLARELRGDPLVGVYEIDPVVAEQRMAERELALGGEAEPRLLDHLGPERTGDRHRLVGRAGVEHHDLVGPLHRGQAPPDVRFLISGEHDDADRDASWNRVVTRWLYGRSRSLVIVWALVAK